MTSDTIVATLPEHTLARARIAVTNLAGMLAVDRSTVDLGELDRMVGEGAALVRTIDAERLAATEPLRNAVAAINEAAKRATGALKEMVRDGARAVVDERKRRREDASRATAVALQRLEELSGSSGADDEIRDAACTWFDSLPTHDAEPRPSSGTAKYSALEIFDPSIIPYEINGIELMRPVQSAIRRLLNAGVDVPGCRMVKREQVRVTPATPAADDKEPA